MPEDFFRCSVGLAWHLIGRARKLKMANPVADLVAIIESVEKDQQGKPKYTNFVNLAALFEGPTGSLSGVVVAEPLAWRDTRFTRRVSVIFRGGKNER